MNHNENKIYQANEVAQVGGFEEEPNQMVEENAQIGQQLSANEPQQQYNEEDMNNYEEEYYEDDYSYDIGVVQRMPSKTGQYQLESLIGNIISEVKQIQVLTNFNFDWAICLYYACGWNKTVCDDYILDQNQKHKKLIHYTNKFESKQGFSGTGDCGVCGEGGVKLVKNICGHQFCFECWKGHLQFRLSNFFKDPFPPCILGQEICDIKMSYTLCELLSNSSQKLHKKFVEVLCRSYASFNAFVKICKGKPGFSCNNCFAIKKMYDIIECQNCGNMVCPRCGEKAHGQSECFELKNWKQLTENSTEFVQFLNYKICPHCKEGVNKSQGCNFMACKCGKAFCFYCGQKWWQPYHRAHSSNPADCPNYGRVKQLEEQKEMRRLNGEEFYNKIQQRKGKIDAIEKQEERVDKLKMQLLPKIKKLFLDKFKFYDKQLAVLENICSFTQKVFCILWGETLSFHFEANKQKQFYCENIKNNIQKIYSFLFEYMVRMYNLLTKDPQMLTEPEKKELTEEAKQKFEREFPQRIKNMESIIVTTEKMIESLANTK